MQPKTYRKTALTQAMYWDGGSEECVSALREWGAEVALLGEPELWRIETKEGWLPMHADGVVCRGPAGDFYQSDRSIFEANYEEVPE